MDALKLNQSNYMRYKTTYYIIMLILNVFNVFDFGIFYEVFVISYIAIMIFDIYMMFFKKDNEEIRSLKKSKYDMVEYMISYSILVVSIVIVSALVIGTAMKVHQINIYSTINIIYTIIFIGVHMYVFVFEMVHRNKDVKLHIKKEASKIRMRLFQILIMMYEVVYIYVYTFTYQYRSEIQPTILSLFIIFPPILTLIIQGLYLQKRNDYLILESEEVK